TATCTPPGATCCAASGALQRQMPPTAVRWLWSTTKPSDACSSGAWPNSARPPTPPGAEAPARCRRGSPGLEQAPGASAELAGSRTRRFANLAPGVAQDRGQAVFGAALGRSRFGVAGREPGEPSGFLPQGPGLGGQVVHGLGREGAV